MACVGTVGRERSGLDSASLFTLVAPTGGLGPLVASVIVTALVDGRVRLRRLLHSCISVRGRFVWVLFAVAALPHRWSYLQLMRSHWAPGVKAPLFACSPGLSSMGFAGVAGWLFSIITGSILMTWLFNASQGSVLAVALFHGVLDIVMTSPVKGPLPSIMGAMITLCGVAVVVVFGRTNLSHGLRVQHQ